jgi:predicted NBD/HSP70 family sugar kinase
MEEPVSTDEGTSVPARSAQLGDLRQQNYSALMRAVMRYGPVARKDLATATGMATGTVTKLTSALAQVGLVRQVDEPVQAGLGRPKVPVVVDESRYAVVGVHFGYHRTITCLLSLAGNLIDEIQDTVRGNAPERLIPQAVADIRTVIERHPFKVLGVGASTGGWVDARSGRVLDQPLLGWHDVALGRQLADALELPVAVDSHLRALAVAEHWFGAATGVDNLLHLFIGNVVGAGLILNGQLFRGARGTAGTLAHLPVVGHSGAACSCGSHQCLSMLAGDLEVTRRAREAGLIPAGGEVHDVIELAQRGNKDADRMLLDRARVVGVAAATLIELFDPELVIVGGGVSAPAHYVDAVRDAALRQLRRDDAADVASMIRASAFGPHAVAIAAAAIVLNEFYRSPEVFVTELSNRAALAASA